MTLRPFVFVKWYPPGIVGSGGYSAVWARYDSEVPEDLSCSWVRLRRSKTVTGRSYTAETVSPPLRTLAPVSLHMATNPQPYDIPTTWFHVSRAADAVRVHVNTILVFLRYRRYGARNIEGIGGKTRIGPDSLPTDLSSPTCKGNNRSGVLGNAEDGTRRRSIAVTRPQLLHPCPFPATSHEMEERQ